MVEYLAGNRIRGTNAERTTGAGFNPVTAVAGGWKELSRFTVGAGQTSDTISVTGLDNKLYLQVLSFTKGTGGATRSSYTMNTVTGNYSYKYNTGSGGDSSGSNQSNLYFNQNNNGNTFTNSFISNKSDKKKLFLNSSIKATVTGAGTAPVREESAGTWGTTTDPISSVQLLNSAGGSFDAGSEVIVLGYDPDDTHTDNFWEELVSVTQASDATTLDTSTFTPKKYMWVQIFGDSSSNISPSITFNGESSGANNNKYTLASTFNGGNDDTSEVNIEWIALNQAGVGNSNNEYFSNIFIVNHTNSEKLICVNTVENDATGTSRAPDRTNNYGKWTDTSYQINRITLTFRDGGTGNVLTGTVMKVWGHD